MVHMWQSKFHPLHLFVVTFDTFAVVNCNCLYCFCSSVANGNGTLVVSNGSYSDKLAPESSSTSDTVVVSSKNTCAVGTIQCEIVKRSGSTKSNSRLPAGTGIKVSADSIPVVVEAADSDNARQLKSDVVEGIEISESLKPLSLSAVNPSQDNQPPQSLHEPVKGNILG